MRTPTDRGPKSGSSLQDPSAPGQPFQAVYIFPHDSTRDTKETHIRKAILTLVIGFVFTTGSARAQDDTKLILAERLLTVMELQKTIEQSFGAVTKMIPGHDSPSEAGKKVVDLIMAELSWDNIKNGYITLYADLFTEKELKDLTAFYESPVGQAYVRKQPELTQRSMMLSQQMMMKIMPKLRGMGR